MNEWDIYNYSEPPSRGFIVWSSARRAMLSIPSCNTKYLYILKCVSSWLNLISYDLSPWYTNPAKTRPSNFLISPTCCHASKNPLSSGSSPDSGNSRPRHASLSNSTTNNSAMISFQISFQDYAQSQISSSTDSVWEMWLLSVKSQPPSCFRWLDSADYAIWIWAGLSATMIW